MADWYVSSAAWTAITQFAASTAYTVGNIVRPLTTPAAGHEYAFRCTTAGTSSTEPTWPAADGATVTTGGATFTNVSGESAYGWSAAAGSLFSISSSGPSNRASVGDRIFLSSDHSESGKGTTYGFNNGTSAFGLIEIISVNRAGSVPPVAADITSGAAITITSGTPTFEAYCNMFWQGVTITSSATGNVTFNSGSIKSHYFKNCAFVISNSGIGIRYTSNNPTKVVFDNTTVQFGATAQGISSNYPLDWDWINTTSAIQGATIPATLFISGTTNTLLGTCRGVDLSAITGTIMGASTSSGGNKILLDSCRIASGVTRLAVPNINSFTADQIELVNCYDGANVLNERHTYAGDITTDRGTYLTSGAQDDIGAYSLKLVSSSRSDFAAFPLDCFAFDVENTVTGASKTATVEIVSSATLNNNDIRLLLEYMGTSGNPVVSFGDSLASVLTAPSALPSSSNTWTGSMFSGAIPSGFSSPISSMAWNPGDLFNTTLSGSNLIATCPFTGANSGARSTPALSSGKFYFELVWTTSVSALGCGVGNSSGSLTGSSGANVAVVNQPGSIYINQWTTSSGSVGAFSNGSVCCIAIDTVNQLIWFRNGPSGSWNATSGTANNPATGTGGISISSISGPYYAYLYTTGVYSGSAVLTANFGASFKQLLQITFTPQRAGRVRGLVRLGKPSTTVWVNPQIAIT